jgi:hypothetical protein
VSEGDSFIAFRRRTAASCKADAGGESNTIQSWRLAAKGKLSPASAQIGDLVKGLGGLLGEL